MSPRRGPFRCSFPSWRSRCSSRRGLGGCRGAGRFLGGCCASARRRPGLPPPDERCPARLDRTLAGSFVGEGTSRAVHLLSSDTAFIAALLRRYRPDLAAARDPWGALARERVVTLAGRSGDGPWRGRGRGSSRPWSARRSGTPRSTVEAMLVRGGGGRDAARAARRPSSSWPTSGPAATRRSGARCSARSGPASAATRERAAGSFSATRCRRRRRRSPASSWAAPSGRSTARSARGTARSASTPTPTCRIEINTLADVDAADVIAFRVADDRVRYAVSLRARRITARGDTLVGDRRHGLG